MTADRPTDPAAIAVALAAPFPADKIRWKPAKVSGSRALAIAYVNAQSVMDRLDEVLGVAGWQDAYEPLPDGSVMCRLRLKIGEQWLEKCDAGAQSTRQEGGNRTKAAYSDALKRAAVKWGVGRYLSGQPQVWCDYDPHKREFVKPPQLPPAKRTAAPARATRQVAALPPPADGAELQRRLSDYDARLAAEGLCQPGDLVAHVRRAGALAGLPADLSGWGATAIKLAVEQTKAFEAGRRKGPRQPAA